MKKPDPINKVHHNDEFSSGLMESYGRWMDGDTFQGTQMPDIHEAPFDGMGLVQRMVFNKWISIDEWNVLKDKFKDAAQEIEDNYDDWPEGEGFGSSDHNFAIKELMEILGYKFDNEDRSGKFVVSDVPDEVKNAGLRNIRQKDPDPIIASEGHSNTRHQAQTMLKTVSLDSKQV